MAQVNNLVVVNPTFHEMSSRLVIVESVDGTFVLRPESGEIFDGGRPGPSPVRSYKITADVVISGCTYAGLWMKFRSCRKFKKLGKLQIYTMPRFSDLLASVRWESIRRVYSRGNDLNVGDDWDWSRGHSAFGGDGVIYACEIIEQALVDEFARIRSLAAWSIFELYRHANHGCFDETDCLCLIGLFEPLQKALEMETDGDARTALLEAEGQFHSKRDHLDGRDGAQQHTRTPHSVRATMRGGSFSSRGGRRHRHR